MDFFSSPSTSKTVLDLGRRGFSSLKGEPRVLRPDADCGMGWDLAMERACLVKERAW